MAAGLMSKHALRRFFSSASPTASTSSLSHSVAPFSTSSSSFLPTPPARSVRGAQDQMAGTVSMLDIYTSPLNDIPEGEDATSLIRNIPSQGVISPGHLSPSHLLNPRLPRPDFTLAYPLGPPVSAAKSLDFFKKMNLSPLDSPMNPFLRMEFCTDMGKIKSRGQTGLQRSSQRKLGKAVRRARAMGIVAVFGRSQPLSEGNGRFQFGMR